MTEKWFTEIDRMGFTEDEKEIVEKVLDYTDAILYYDNNAYKTEDPSETYYYNTKEDLMDNFTYTYNELKKEGVFDEEGAPADPWLKVLEDRVEEWQSKFNSHDRLLTASIKEFKSWVAETSDSEILGIATFKLNELNGNYKAYNHAWHELGKAKDELAAYKETMNY